MRTAKTPMGRLFFLTVTFVLLLVEGYGQQADYIKPNILHSPVTNIFEGQTITIEAVVTDNQEVEDVILYYRNRGEEYYKYLSMELEFNNYILDIPEEWGITGLMVEHDMGMVMDISDHIAVLNFGQVITEGLPADVQNNPEVIKAYLGNSDIESLRKKLNAEGEAA